MVAFVVTLALGVALWAWLGGGRALESLAYHAERGLEIESLFGGLVLLVGTFTGAEVPWVFDHNAYHVASSWGNALARLSLPLQAAAIVLVVWRFWRSGMGDGPRFSAAAILAFICFGKVLSPQYLIWLFPFVAVGEGATGRLARQTFTLACLTTALIYPGPGFVMLLDHQVGAILMLNLRNVLLIGLLAILLRHPGTERVPSA
jgi:hypothetical protein